MNSPTPCNFSFWLNCELWTGYQSWSAGSTPDKVVYWDAYVIRDGVRFERTIGPDELRESN